MSRQIGRNVARLVILLSLLLIALYASTAASTSDQGKNVSTRLFHHPRVRLGFDIIKKMFNFDAYKRLFHKSYSILENLLRRKYFLARALRVYVSQVKYKYYKMSYYLGLNYMSDMTPAELDMMDNRVEEEEEEEELNSYKKQKTIKGVEFTRIGRADSDVPLPGEHRQGVEDRISETAKQIIDTGEGLTQESVSGPALEAGSSVGPQKRIKRDTGAPLDDATLNGPYMNVTYYSFVIADEEAKQSGKQQRSRREMSEPDVLFVDHRKSGCLVAPRGQGKCGSCYTFSTVAYMEWLSCKLSGKRIAFSEQYLVDCGRKRVGNMKGCSGGSRQASGQFVLNFGMELRRNYPYYTRQDKCPYANDTNLAATGVYKFDRLDIGSIVDRKLWHEQIGYAPMLISLVTKDTGFKEYGGGVFDPSNCNPNREGGHSVLLVGHGRQDGQRYWLLRNSYSVGWGERGYMKLSEETDCIKTGVGYMYGTMDGGETFVAKLRKNKLNDPSFVQRHYKINQRLDRKAKAAAADDL